MTGWRALLDALGLCWFTNREVRAEAFSLGARHRGEVLDGAWAELKAPHLDRRRAALLRAVIRRAPRLAHGGVRP
jgi:hypothetical protein